MGDCHTSFHIPTCGGLDNRCFDSLVPNRTLIQKNQSNYVIVDEVSA